MISNQPFINVYIKKSSKSKLATQLLYGDSFKKIKEEKSWIKIKNHSDKYVGFIKKRNFSTKKKIHIKFLIYQQIYIQNLILK